MATVAISKRKYDGDTAFKLAHSLHKEGMRNKDIAKMLRYSHASISTWLGFETRKEWLDYCKNQALLRAKKEKGNGQSLVEPSTNSKAISPELSPIVGQLNTIIAVLKAIEFKLNLK